MLLWSSVPRRRTLSPKFTVRWQSSVSVPTGLKVAATRWHCAQGMIAPATARQLFQSQFPGHTVGRGAGPGPERAFRGALPLRARRIVVGTPPFPKFSGPQRAAQGYGEKARSLPPVPSPQLGGSASHPIPRAPPPGLPLRTPGWTRTHRAEGGGRGAERALRTRRDRTSRRAAMAGRTDRIGGLSGGCRRTAGRRDGGTAGRRGGPRGQPTAGRKAVPPARAGSAPGSALRPVRPPRPAAGSGEGSPESRLGAALGSPMPCAGRSPKFIF